MAERASNRHAELDAKSINSAFRIPNSALVFFPCDHPSPVPVPATQLRGAPAQGSARCALRARARRRSPARRFFSTTNLPTYVKAAGAWSRPRLPRMDCVIVRQSPRDLVTTEPRKVRKGQAVAVGTEEDGSQGIFVHAEGFLGGSHSANEFGFMQTEVSRERPVDYAVLAQLLGEEKQRGGKIVWVVGPALVHARAREDMIWFIKNGYVQAFLGGNAVAVHDLEAAIFGTTLGMTSSGQGVEGGHALHMRAINQIRRAGGIAAAVRQGLVSSGIMHALVTHGVPFVLAGSIRDDGPLPEVLSDTLAAQD